MNRMPLFRVVVALVAVAALALPALAKDDALSLVPANAVTVGMVKLADMRTSPLSSLLFEHTDKMSSDGEAEKFLSETGLSPTKDVGYSRTRPPRVRTWTEIESAFSSMPATRAATRPPSRDPPTHSW